MQAYQQYRDFKDHTSWSLQGNYDLAGVLNARPVDQSEPFGFLARNRTSGLVFVAFRGTESPDDWLSDLRFPQRDHPWGEVGQGFGGIYDQCSADVRRFVGSAGSPGNAAPGPVVVTGHSLGAALAILASADLVDSGVAPDVAMYSFAGPRTGSPGFAGEFNRRIPRAWRIVNTEDIVPTLPLATVELLQIRGVLQVIAEFFGKFEYEHVGMPVCFTTQSGSIPANHDMATYLAAIQAS